jgi:hypothetical protein
VYRTSVTLTPASRRQNVRSGSRSAWSRTWGGKNHGVVR